MMIEKIFGVLNGLTFGLLNHYRKRSLHLFKLAAVKLYMKGLKAVRKHALILFLATFCMLTLAVTVVVVPVALVMLAPWSASVKAAVLAVFGIGYVGVSALVIANLFSEKRWMSVALSDELLNEVKKSQES